MGREKTRQRIAIRKAFAPKKNKPATTHTKNHRFESFSQRVARLKIDPIRRDRGLNDDRDLEGLESHFKIALDKWRDLNLSEDFTRFARKVAPLSENLPQVLHHQNEIVDALLESIQDSKAVSAEPLLDLVAHLARDLQIQFENHFERTVTVVAGVAARHSEVEVVEWCFNCLTWLFKYLERILATDIRPLFDLLKPYLGKERQKPHVSRFAAESLSFLVKRVGKRPDATRRFVRHVLSDLEETAKEKDTELYEHSLMALFLEAIKGVKEALHSSGPTIFASLLAEVLDLHLDENSTESTSRLVRGIFLQLVHHASAENLAPLVHEIISEAEKDINVQSERGKRAIIIASQLLLLAVNVKSGQRVSNWTALFKHISGQVELLTGANPSDHKDVAVEVLSVLAVAHQKCPLDAALLSLTTLDKLCSKTWQNFFLGFCHLYAEYGRDRFQSFVFPRLQRFLATHWEGQIKAISILVPKLVREGLIMPQAVKLPDGMVDEFATQFALFRENGEECDKQSFECDGILKLLDVASGADRQFDKVNQLLYLALEEQLQSCKNTQFRSFVLGDGFLHLAKNGSGQTINLNHLLPLIANAASGLKDYPAFFQAVAACFQSYGKVQRLQGSSSLQKLRDVLLQCLSSRSHNIRLASLVILSHLVSDDDQEWKNELSAAIEVEETEPSLETARYISMKIQNLGMRYKSYASKSILLAQALPRWLFGLLHVQFAQMWEDACAALKVIGETKEGEEVICDVAFQWLSDSPLRDDQTASPPESSEGILGDYFSKIRNATVGRLTFADYADVTLQKEFDERHLRVAILTPFSRTQALKVLKAVPQLAEKKARQLVPVLLSWSTNSGDSGDSGVAENTDEYDESQAFEDSHDEHVQWPRKDQKDLLTLFAAFNNPKVLYKSGEVYSTLLSFIAHGDVEIQKSSLLAILAWKDKTLKKYADELFKFLDEARLREQLTVFLDGNGENALALEDRPAVIPIVLRLVYGRIIARSRNERGSNRKAVFIILAKFSEDEINDFLDVILAPMASQNDAKNVPSKRQIGMLNMVKDLLETWRTTAAPYVHRLVPPVSACLIGSATNADGATNLSKALRHVAMQCLNLCFEAGDDFNFTPFMPDLFEHIVRPRLERFAEENAQGVSALLKMLAIWAKSGKLSKHLFEHDTLLLPKVIECVSLQATKEPVKRFVLNDILRAVISNEEGDRFAEMRIINISTHLLEHIALSIPLISSKELIEDTISTVVAVFPFSNSCPPLLLSEAARLVLQPTRKVPHHTKTDLLAILSHFFPSILEDESAQKVVFSAVCSSFGYFADGKSRSLLVEVAQKFADQDHELHEVIALLDDINAFLPNHLDTPDFERRSRAFGIITEERWTGFSAKQWRLLLGNLLFYIKDTEELAIRASASHALRRFVMASSSKTGSEKDDFAGMMQTLLINIENGLKEQPELVQSELLSVLAEIARLPGDDNSVYDLHHLLMGGDEEASFFTNILHVQQHRRVRAMNRLSNIAADGLLSSRSLYHLLLPILESFVFKGEDGVLIAEAIKTTGSLVEWLDWQQCKALIKKYIGFIKSKEDVQETVLKLLDAVTNGFSRSAALRAESRTNPAPQKEACGDEDDEQMDQTTATATKLAKTLPGAEKLSQYIIDETLPPLSIFLREKDESFVSRRISVALIAAKFVQLLPEMEFRLRFPPLLTDVCNILRSRDQGSRDQTRRALSSICILAGPSSFGYILRELRGALQRGFYLHVLAFSVHSILEQTIAKFQPGDLDYCLEDIVDVVVEDIFGNTGKEKDLEDYKADKNTRKEVKGKKSFDTMQILASVTTLGYLIQLVRPIQALLSGSLSVKEVRYVDELLRRIELGVLQNESLKNRDILRFCYEIVQEAHRVAPPVVHQKTKQKSSTGLVESAYLLQAPRKTSQPTLHASEASAKITRFGLELVRSVLKKNKDLLTPSNVSGFMPLMGDALLSPNEDVKLAALRLFVGIINVPLPRIDADAPVYIAEAANIIENGQNNGGELEQAALKLISAVLRERKSAPVKVKPKTISVLLKKLKGDFQIISQQGAAFNLLRSIISRQIIVPELYEVMDGDDGVAAISVRDHDRTTRDLARSIYFQFLMDCPQGEKRWTKQLAFLRGNLEYDHAEGRKSVMETIHLLLNKVGDELVGSVVKEVFWPLVSVMVNDADTDCREMAARLVKEVFERANDEWLQNFCGLCERLLSQGNAVQKRTALQCWTLYLEVKEENAEGVESVLANVKDILAQREFDAEQWQLVYWALHTFVAVTQARRTESGANDTEQIWIDARRCINFPHLWVKQEAVNMITVLFTQIASSGNVFDSFPLPSSFEVTLQASDMCELASRHLRLLKDGVTRELAASTVRNLAFIGKIFATTGISWQSNASSMLAVKELDDNEEVFQGLSDAEEEEQEDVENVDDNLTAIKYLLSKLAAIIRRQLGKMIVPGPRQADSLLPKSAALSLLAALCNTLSLEALEESAVVILEPLVHLTSPDLSVTSFSTADFKNAHEELVTNATELQDTLRNKLGTSAFVDALQRVKAARSARREERRAKRKIDAVARPEIAAKKKAKRMERESEKRRAKNSLERGRRRGW
ncbi:uncharacterized protein PV09_05805 [Verruconis gallopava]|uniref:Uncharacterized protein n=1 Tax=Verruconis gallopava TaxID=253628 RepID=A0A0D1YRD7_9PEZI|nr:uncharacterized protein PV09_05805 [Verruconis gallopava]KIW03162.1 hypothetical protein PV09_05805 [Verruconis gallopava]